MTGPGGRLTERCYRFGGHSVVLRATESQHEYLARFYPPAPGREPAAALWLAGSDGAGPRAVIEENGRRVLVRYSDRAPVDALRLAARSRWLATLPPDRLLLHATALRWTDQVVIVVGLPHSGKTTLLMDGLLAHGATALAYDSLLIDLAARIGECVPAIMNVRHRTLARVPGAAAMLAGHELALDGSARSERYYAPGGFPLPDTFALPPGRTTVLASRGFAGSGPAVLAPLSPGATAARLSDLLSPWGGYADVDRVATLLGLPGPTPRERHLRSAPRLAALADGLALSHHGCPAPVLSRLGRRVTPCRERWV